VLVPLAVALALGLLGGIALAVFVAPRQPAHGRMLFSPRFGSAGLVTNEYAYRHPHAEAAAHSPDWQMTSGSLFARAGGGWSGLIDARAPDALSLSGTNSSVFRLVSRHVFENYSISFSWRINRFPPTATSRNWDGLHLWLRHQSPKELYFISFRRRDGLIVIGKKMSGGDVNGGRYTSLRKVRRAPAPLGAWQKLRATIETDGSAVTIRLLLGGALVARAVDREGVDKPILSAGRVGLRGDNAEFEFRTLEVRSL